MMTTNYSLKLLYIAEWLSTSQDQVAAHYPWWGSHHKKPTDSTDQSYDWSSSKASMGPHRDTNTKQVGWPVVRVQIPSFRTIWWQRLVEICTCIECEERRSTRSQVCSLTFGIEYLRSVVYFELRFGRWFFGYPSNYPDFNFCELSEMLSKDWSFKVKNWNELKWSSPLIAVVCRNFSSTSQSGDSRQIMTRVNR